MWICSGPRWKRPWSRGPSAGQCRFIGRLKGLHRPRHRAIGRVLVHGVGIRPGKPVILGATQNIPSWHPGLSRLGSPDLQLFVRPILSRMMGQAPPIRKRLRLAWRRIVSPLGMEEFVRVRLGEVKGQVVALPMGRGRATCQVWLKPTASFVPRLSQGLEADEEVEVELLCSKQQIKRRSSLREATI